MESEEFNTENITNYEIISQIGEGGMGEVFLARDLRLNRRVALKILRKNFASNIDRLNRFRREARAVSALNHPNILTIFEFGKSGDTHFLASEFIKGKTLRELLNENSLTILETLDITLQTASALQAAHEAGVIHRDIKPENVMIREDGYVKVLDFGLAKLTEAEQVSDTEKTREFAPGEIFEAEKKSQTMAGTVMGTASYMSPEQARGLMIDGRTDIFSLGAVLFEMLTRRRLFRGETINHIIVAVLENPLPPLSKYVKDYPAEIERILHRCLEKDARLRYQTTHELLTDLRQLFKRLEFEKEFKHNIFAEPQSIDKTQTFPVQAIETLPIVGDFSGESFRKPPPNNLSVSLTPIIGREKEIAEVSQILRRSEVRLLTLTGIGGTGKTRLSQAVAQNVLNEFSDGVYLVELGSIFDSKLVAPTIAQTLGVKESGGNSVNESLQKFLKDKEILLVVDNFEQVTNAAQTIAELISAAPKLKILITSRTLLRIRAETEFPVPPLALPQDFSELSAEDLSENEAVKLFAERARNAKANFAVTDENAKAIAEICARLEGLPLAIELAAARTKILSPGAILSKLENRLQLLTGGAQDLPSRQQTMRGAVAWSYDLLDTNEKTLFEMFSVFVGGFTFEAAEAVCEIALQNSSPNVLDGITSLIDKSLFISKEQPDGEMRFRMLEVVREFAAESLQKSGANERAKFGHAEYFLALGEEAAKHLKSKDSAKWLNQLEEEHDNFRAVLQRFLVTDDIEKAARTAYSLRLFWLFRSHLAEGRGWLEKVLEKIGDDKNIEQRFSLFDVLGTLRRFQGDYEAAQVAYKKMLKESFEAGKLWETAEANSGLGSIAYQQGDFETAKKYLTEFLRISRELNEKYGIASALNSLGDIARTEEDFTAARTYLEESLAVSRELGTKQFVCATLANLGAVTFAERDLAAAHLHFKEALELAQELGNRTVVSLSLDGFAALAAERGETIFAAQISSAADYLRESIGYEIEPADLNFRDSFLKKIRAELSDDDLSQSFEKGRRLKTEEAVLLCLEDLSNLKTKPGRL